jgi:exportin-2 (importin alpha re-exporter)
LFSNVQLVAKLKAAAANPVNPSFNHYMFETIAALVKNVCSVHSDALPAFDSTLCPLVREILDQDVVEFGPYGFQLLAQLLDLHRVTGTQIPPDYIAMLPPLFMPVFWERPGYVPALTPLIIGYMYTATAEIVSNEQARQLRLPPAFRPTQSHGRNQHSMTMTVWPRF